MKILFLPLCWILTALLLALPICCCAQASVTGPIAAYITTGNAGSAIYECYTLNSAGTKTLPISYQLSLTLCPQTTLFGITIPAFTIPEGTYSTDGVLYVNGVPNYCGKSQADALLLNAQLHNK